MLGFVKKRKKQHEEVMAKLDQLIELLKKEQRPLS